MARGPKNPPAPAVEGELLDAEALAEPVDEGPVLVRLNKYLADHGVASRRHCDELIAKGKVSVDGEPVTELGLKIDPERQSVEIGGVVLTPRGARRRYYLLNKPAGVVCTSEPRETRPRAVDLVTDPRKGRIYTVGRLDEESKGLILLTNDGDFANRIMHPRYGVEKTYVVKVAGKIDDEALQRVREGVHLSEGRTAGARILVLKRERDTSTLALSLREGMNREIRRAFARVGYKVVELKRTRIGPLSDRGLKIGRWRELAREEVEALLSGRGEAEGAGERLRHAARKPRGGPGRSKVARDRAPWTPGRARDGSGAGQEGAGSRGGRAGAGRVHRRAGAGRPRTASGPGRARANSKDSSSRASPAKGRSLTRGRAAQGGRTR